MENQKNIKKAKADNNQDGNGELIRRPNVFGNYDNFVKWANSELLDVDLKKYLPQTADDILPSIILLRRFQDWRRGYDIRQLPDTGINNKELGIAIDNILAFFGQQEPLTFCELCRHNTGVTCARILKKRLCEFERR